MKLAILHYHLGPGGVTRVIGNHLRCLSGDPAIEAVAIVSDGDRSGWAHDDFGFPVRFLDFPEMAYQESDTFDPQFADRLESSLVEQGFDRESTCLHAHNHSLGKTAEVAAALATLVDRGWRVLYQIHDFAEDFRPEGYGRLRRVFGDRFGPRVFPPDAAAHFAVLNSEDRRSLQTAGVPDDRLHFLPNPVLPSSSDSSRPSRDEARQRFADVFGLEPEATFWLYPVRGIRRKNIGEAVLLAAAKWRHHEGTPAVVAITLAPANPNERPQWDEWIDVVDRYGLPVVFGSGDSGRMSYAENLAAADAIVTTSIAEGFGMVFLEAWLNDLPLIGRDLPGITQDFTAAGVDLSAMYQTLPIPLGWFHWEAFRDRMADAFATLSERYEQTPPTPADFADRFVDPTERAGKIDFARLDEAAQREVIGRVLQDSAAAAAIVGCLTEPSQDVVAANRQVVESVYGEAASRERLLAVYRAVVGGVGTAASVDPGRLLTDADFGKLSLDRFRMLRT